MRLSHSFGLGALLLDHSSPHPRPALFSSRPVITTASRRVPKEVFFLYASSQCLHQAGLTDYTQSCFCIVSLRNEASPNKKRWLQDILLWSTLFPQHCSDFSPVDLERALSTTWLQRMALPHTSTPSKAETKHRLLTNRFICILTGAQILDTDFFCTTVQ